MVDTDLNAESRRARQSSYRGIAPDIVAHDTMQAMAADQFEIAVGDAAGRMMAAHDDPDGAFRAMNGT
jgi:hypothetical protein